MLARFKPASKKVTKDYLKQGYFNIYKILLKNCFTFGSVLKYNYCMKNKTIDINKDIKKSLIWSIVISVLFVAGIPLIIVGATKSIWLVLGLGIVCTVIGFYGSPLMWISYGNKRALKHVVDAVMEDNLTTVEEIAKQLQIRDRQVRDYVIIGIKKKYITGYIFDGTILTANQKEAPKKKITTNKCPNCGGALQTTENGYTCIYCGSHFDKE